MSWLRGAWQCWQYPECFQGPTDGHAMQEQQHVELFVCEGRQLPKKLLNFHVLCILTRLSCIMYFKNVDKVLVSASESGILESGCRKGNR